jgi:hypothetical protein
MVVVAAAAAAAAVVVVVFLQYNCKYLTADCGRDFGEIFFYFFGWFLSSEE